MAIVAKWLTHRIVAPTLVGSIPIIRPSEDSAKFVGSFLLSKERNQENESEVFWLKNTSDGPIMDQLAISYSKSFKRSAISCCLLGNKCP